MESVKIRQAVRSVSRAAVRRMLLGSDRSYLGRKYAKLMAARR